MSSTAFPPGSALPDAAPAAGSGPPPPQAPQADLWPGMRRGIAYVALFSLAANLLQLTGSLYTMQVFDRVLPAQSAATLAYLTLLALAAVVVLGVMEATRALLMQRLGLWLGARLARQSFAATWAPEPQSERSSAGLKSHTGNPLHDLELCRNFLGSPVALALFDLPWCPLYFALLVALHPLLGVAGCSGAVLLVLASMVGGIAFLRLVPASRGFGAANARLVASVARHLDYAHAAGFLPVLQQRWLLLHQAGLAQQARMLRGEASVLGATRGIRAGLQIVLLAIGGALVLRHDITAGVAIAATVLAGRALAPLEVLSSGWRSLPEIHAAWRRLMQRSAHRDAAVPVTLPQPRGFWQVGNLTFHYPSCPIATLRGLSFALAPGEILALHGPTAAGKSTLLRLLAGALPAPAGAIRLDGLDMARWREAGLARHLGYLPHAAPLFPGTVAENIARFMPANGAALHGAAQMVGALETLLRLPNGFETMLGGAENTLSAGEQQLIALARAVFGMPRLLLLDEPDVGLDAAGEARLRQGLEALKRTGSTIILATNRPALLMAADKVLLLHEGTALAFGPRAQILRPITQRDAGPREGPAAASQDAI